MTEEAFPQHPMKDTAFYETQKGPRTTLRDGYESMTLDKAEADLIRAERLTEIRNSLHLIAGRIGVLSFVTGDTLPVEPGLNNGLDVIGHLAALNVTAEQIRECVSVMESAI